MSEKESRRSFIAKTTVAAAGVSMGIPAISASNASRIIGANDKIKMGFIGIGNRGSQLLRMFMQYDDVEVTAFCDVYQPYVSRDRSKVSSRYLEELNGRIPQLGEKFPKQPKAYSDYRKLLEDNDIDAVCIAAPDHWHPLKRFRPFRRGKMYM